jgi:hypothetical protein
MAENIVAGLFGLTPQMYGEQQRRSALQEGITLAQLDPAARGAAMTYAGARGLGNAIGGAFGVEDPQLKMISARNAVAKQIDQTNPESILQGAQMLAQAGDQQGAMALAQYARQAQSEMALVQQRRAAEQSSLATAAKTQLSIAQETKLRDELSKLPQGATQDDVLAVLTKYGSPDRVIAALTASASRTEAIQARTATAEAANQARIDAAKTAADAALERAKVLADAKIEAAATAGATAKEIARMRVDSAKEIAQTRIDSAKDLKEFANSLKGPKVLAPSLQREEDKELELVDSLTARETSLAPAIATLTPDPKTGKPPLELGPVNNLRYQAQNAAGNSSVESRNYAALQRAVQEATNLKTDAAKGVQTDKDVLRFANELIAAFGGNDTKTTLEALSNFSKSTAKAKENAQKRIDSRRKSQGVEPYYGPAVGTAQNPIKLD